MKNFFVIGIIFCFSFLCFLQALSKKQSALEAGLLQGIEGYSKWTRLNKKIIKPRSQDPHRGFKRVYINRVQENLIDSNGNLIFPYPEGTIIVKEARKTRNKKSEITLISIMRKLPANETTGGWECLHLEKVAGVLQNHL